MIGACNSLLHNNILYSSAVAFCGMVGYSAYAPTKFALRGLADCLRNELVGSGVKVSIFYPSNMDTPGFAVENKTKPAETSVCMIELQLYKT